MDSKWHLPTLITFLIVLTHHLEPISGTTFVWNQNEGSSGSWQRPLLGSVPVCVDIPVNMSLCHGIGYTKMRLPNLLHHDSLQEVSQQAVGWVPLFKLGCHPDTQLFLCSLFTPVCLDHPIPPCRSLCESVQSSCESTMLKYGYPWPHIVRCDQFPVDNDMCIQAQHSNIKAPSNLLGKVRDDVGSRQSNPSSLGSSSYSSFSSSSSSEVGSSSSSSFSNTLKEKNKRRRKHRNHGINQGPEETRGGPKEERKLSRSEDSWREETSKFEPDIDSDTSSSSSRLLPSSEDQHRRSSSSQDGRKRQRQGLGPNPKTRKERNNEVFNDMLTNYCFSDWSLKARGSFEPQSSSSSSSSSSDNKTLRLKIRNYRVIHGNFSETSRDVLLEVPSNATRSTEFGSKPGANGRHRYYIMGSGLQARFVLPWPHKLGQFRKALKLIRNKNVKCESHANPKSSPLINPSAMDSSTSRNQEGEDESKTGHQSGEGDRHQHQSSFEDGKPKGGKRREKSGRKEHRRRQHKSRGSNTSNSNSNNNNQQNQNQDSSFR